MKVTLHSSHGVAKSVTVDCSPAEYLVLISALRNMADIHPDNIKMAEQMLENGKACYEEEDE